MQNAQQYSDQEINYFNSLIQPNDVLKISVNALVPETAIPYNKSSEVGAANVELLQLGGYLVTNDLTIDFPILGILKLDNMTTQDLSQFLNKKLVKEGHLKSPTVEVRLLNAKVTILGQVNRPGTYTFTEQNITLLQALGYAGDLTINGKREDIMILRYENGIQKIAHIDLTSAEWLQGPYSFIKPNDQIIVNPNNPKVKSAGFVGNVGTVISVVSILLTTIVLITR